MVASGEVRFVDDTVQISCGRCKGRFRERARKLVSGFSSQCPSCEAVFFFDDASPKIEIRKALLAAKNVRRALHLEAEEKLKSSVTYVFSRQ
jgi:hypothetical protein